MVPIAKLSVKLIRTNGSQGKLMQLTLQTYTMAFFLRHLGDLMCEGGFFGRDSIADQVINLPTKS